MKFRDAMASLYPTAEKARASCAIVDSATKVRDLNFKYVAEGKGATVTARFGPDGITLGDPNRAANAGTWFSSGFMTGRFDLLSRHEYPS